MKPGGLNENQDQLARVIAALERVNQMMKQTIFNYSTSMSELDVIQSFNQNALDLFTNMIKVATELNLPNQSKKASGFKVLFDKAIKSNIKLPLEKFCLVILEYAPEIYEDCENYFLEMEIPDADVKVGNDWGMLRSKEFKDTWLILTPNMKERIKNPITLMTIYSHVYFYQTIIRHNAI